MFVFYTGKGQRVPRGVVSVRFHPGVTEIEEDAFRNCLKLQDVVFNEGLQKIGALAFYSCKALQSIKLPSTITEISKSAFRIRGCKRSDILHFGTVVH